jgi:hypothetical protein
MTTDPAVQAAAEAILAEARKFPSRSDPITLGTIEAATDFAAEYEVVLAQRDALSRQVEKVRARHVYVMADGAIQGTCPVCTDEMCEPEPYPCATIRALDES